MQKSRALSNIKNQIVYTENETLNNSNLEELQNLYYVTMKQLAPVLDRVGRSFSGKVLN